MTDVSMAVEQDAIADSLMGEPQEQTVEQTGTEQQEAFEQPQSVETEAETQQETDNDEWLPSDQDKVFPDEVYSRYAQRYQLTPEQAADPLLRQLLHDKINTDIFVRSQQQQLQQPEYEEYEEQQEPTPQPQITREQWLTQLDQAIQQRTDPEIAKAFHADFLRAFGVPEAEIQKAPPDQAMRFTSVASKYMLNLVNTFMGDMFQAQLGQQLNQAYPGFGDMYERSAYAMAWDQVRNANPQQALPAYGTKEFTKALRDAAAKIPGFDDLQFTGRNGQPLGMMENAQRKYAMLAQSLSGNVDPRLLQQAAAAQVRNSRRADMKRANGNLGSGQAKAASQRVNSQFQTNQDIFDDATMDLYQREHGRL